MSQVVQAAAARIKHQQHGPEGGHAGVVETGCSGAILPGGDLLQIIQAEERVDESIQHKAARARGILFVPVVGVHKPE